MAASGTQGTPVVVWVRASYQRFFSHVVNALRALGYRARLRLVDDQAYYDALQRAGPGTVQAGYVGWATSYPSTAEFVESLFGFLNPTAQLSDPAVEREIERALELQQTDPLAANNVWARVDRMLVDRGVLVPLYNERSLYLVSTRVGNFQSHPFWAVLLDQLWVR